MLLYGSSRAPILCISISDALMPDALAVAGILGAVAEGSEDGITSIHKGSGEAANARRTRRPATLRKVILTKAIPRIFRCGVARSRA